MAGSSSSSKHLEHINEPKIVDDPYVFRYDPIDLEGTAIRLLRLRRGSFSVPECDLFQAWKQGDEPMEYEALSYAWGDTTRREHILVNEKRFPVTRNLYTILESIRLTDQDRVLWIDAICIDQTDKREQGHQVRQMGDIYSRAERVIFWLGEPTRETRTLMQCLKSVQAKSHKYACGNWGCTDPRWGEIWDQVESRSDHTSRENASQTVIGLLNLFERAWWKRVWIVQEVARAKSAIVYCGFEYISSRIFAVAPSMLNISPEPHVQAVLDVMPGPSRQSSWWSQNRDLYTLLERFQQSEATDERDKTYALLGLASDSDALDFPRVDYEKSPEQVHREVAWYLFGLTGIPEKMIGNFFEVIYSLKASAITLLQDPHPLVTEVPEWELATAVLAFLSPSSSGGDWHTRLQQLLKKAAQCSGAYASYVVDRSVPRTKAYDSGRPLITEDLLIEVASHPEELENMSLILLIFFHRRNPEIVITDEVIDVLRKYWACAENLPALLTEARSNYSEWTQHHTKAVVQCLCTAQIADLVYTGVEKVECAISTTSGIQEIYIEGTLVATTNHGLDVPASDTTDMAASPSQDPDVTSTV